MIFELFYKRLKEFEKVTQFDKANFINVINVKSSEPHIYIMETWTNMLLEQAYSEAFSSAIVTNIKKGNKVGILLLNPENQELVGMRKSQFVEDSQDINIEGNIYRNICKINEIKKELGKDKNNLEIRFYNIPPTFAIYANQEDLYLTFYKDDEQSTEGKLIRLDRDGEVSQFIIEQFFKSVWNDQKTTHLENMMYLSLNVREMNFREIKYIRSLINNNDAIHEIYYIQSSGKLDRCLTEHTEAQIEINDNYYEWSELEPSESDEEKIRNLLQNKYGKYNSNPDNNILKLTPASK